MVRWGSSFNDSLSTTTMPSLIGLVRPFSAVNGHVTASDNTVTCYFLETTDMWFVSRLYSSCRCSLPTSYLLYLFRSMKVAIVVEIVHNIFARMRFCLCQYTVRGK